jgi:hypothetical protein
MADTHSTLYTKAVQVTEEYLGPAGERFLRRQIETHLKIKPEALQKKNLPKLINWASIAFAMLTNKDEDLKAFKEDLESLSQSGSR